MELVFVVGVGYSVIVNNFIDEIYFKFSFSWMKKEKEVDCYYYLCEFIYSFEVKCKY